MRVEILVEYNPEAVHYRYIVIPGGVIFIGTIYRIKRFATFCVVQRIVLIKFESMVTLDDNNNIFTMVIFQNGIGNSADNGIGIL